MVKKRLKTYPMSERHNLVKIKDFAKLPEKKFEINGLIESLPWQHAGKVIRDIINALVFARQQQKSVILGMGAHVIKCGLNPYLIELLQKEAITAIALNGAGSIHDFELAAFGETSEDVAKELAEGRFGCVEETGSWMSEAISDGHRAGRGMGEALYDYMKTHADRFPFRDTSLIWQTGELGVACTVHVAIGTDFTHIHHKMSGTAIGSTSFKDFDIFCEQVEQLEKGVYWNLGSAVVLPEVFLKAVSRAHNLGNTLDGMTTINMDMIMQYRSMTNVVKRPSIGVGNGYHLTGHHEIMLPIVALAFLEGLKQDAKK